jgi:hypothetical protein
MLLLAIPVAVHLFKPRKIRRTPFSSLRFLRQTRQRLSRRIQWHQLLLFFLRAGFVALLVLALARPLLTAGDASKPVDRYVVVDVGRGMAYQPAGKSAPVERARDAATALVRNARPIDRTAVLLAGSGSRMVTPPTHDSEVPPELAQLRPGTTDADLGSALPLLKPLIAHGRPEAEQQICFVTANRRSEWSEASIAAFRKGLPDNVHMRVVDVGLAGPQNAWIAGARVIPAPTGKGQLLRVDIGCVGDAVQERTVNLLGPPEWNGRGQTVTLEPGSATRVDFEIAAAADLLGRTAEVRLDPPDALPDDDRYFVNLDASAALRVLLVEPETQAAGQRPAGFYLANAVDALAASGNQALALTRRGAGLLTAADCSAADVTFLAGVPDLPEAARAALEQRVQAGASLVVFLGPAVHADSYNNRLFRPLQPTEGLLPAALGAVVEADRAAPAPLTGFRWSHPLLAGLNDPKTGDLTETKCRAYFRFTAGPAETDAVLARVGDVPAIVERTLGAGKVLLFNTTANDDWSDLPRRRSFVPLVDRLLDYLSAGGVRRGLEAGWSVTLPLAAGRSAAGWTVRTPTGGSIPARGTTANGRPLLRLDEVAEAGAYRVEKPGEPPLTFVVNVGRGDSPLAPMDEPTLTRWFEPLAVEIVKPEALASASDPSATAWPLAVWLVALAGGLLLLEMVFVHRACPRPNPVVAEAVVGRGGLLRPLKG